MRQFITNLISEAEHDLENMKKSEMTLTERIKYERALIKLKTARQLVARFNIE